MSTDEQGSIGKDRPVVVARPASGALTYVDAMCVVSAAFLVVLSGAAAANGVWAVLPLAFTLFVCIGVLTWRMHGLALLAFTDELVIRNLMYTRRIAKTSITAFRIGGPPFARTIVVDLVDGTTASSDAMSWSTAGFHRRGSHGGRQVEDVVAQLEFWREHSTGGGM